MKKPISATIDEELIKWIEKELGNNSLYRNKSHLIEVALDNLKSQISDGARKSQRFSNKEVKK